MGEIAANFRTSRPAISKHLRTLRSAGLVVARKEGTTRVCRLNARPLRAVNDWLRDPGAGRAHLRRPFRVAGEYREIVPPRLLVFTWLPDWQEDAAESLVRFELEEMAGITTVRLTHSGLTSENARARHRGWPQILVTA